MGPCAQRATLIRWIRFTQQLHCHPKTIWESGLVILTRSQWHTASGSKTYYPTDVTSPGAGSSQRAQWAWPQPPVAPHRTAASFLRDLAALTGGRYHCPVGEDSLLEMQGLLTRGFIHQRVGCRAAGWVLLKRCNKYNVNRCGFFFLTNN